MPKEQRTFTQEFKQEAMRLVRTSGKSITQVARDLGIADSTLHHWCKLVAEQGEQAFPGSGHQTALEEENRRLKRELEVTRQERDILKRGMLRWSSTGNEQGYTGGGKIPTPRRSYCLIRTRTWLKRCSRVS